MGGLRLNIKSIGETRGSAKKEEKWGITCRVVLGAVLGMNYFM